MPSTTENLASRLRQVRRMNRAQRESTDGTARELIVVAFSVPLLAVAALAVCLVAVLLMAGSAFSGMVGALGGVWLAVHQVPVTLSGVSLGALPMLPTLILAAGTAAVASSAASTTGRTGRELGAIIAAATAGPVFTTAMALAVVMDSESVLRLQGPDPLVAFGYTFGIHLVSAAAGVGWQARAALIRRLGISAADRTGLRSGLTAVLAILAAGSMLVLIRVFMRWSEIGALFEGGADFDGYLGLFVLSVLYLPNIVIGAAAVLVGADAHVGAASVDLLSVRGGGVPPLPILGVLPGSDAGLIGAFGFAVPALIALWVAWRCRSVDLVANIRSVAVAAATAATVLTALAALSGGEIGELGTAGAAIAATGVFMLGWIGVVGLIVALVHAALPSTRAARLVLADVVLADPDEEYQDPSGYDDDYVTEEFADYEPEFDNTGYEDAEYDETGYDDAGYDDEQDLVAADGDEDDDREAHTAGTDDEADQNTEAATAPRRPRPAIDEFEVSEYDAEEYELERRLAERMSGG